jgi:hypothetical protein
MARGVISLPSEEIARFLEKYEADKARSVVRRARCRWDCDLCPLEIAPGDLYLALAGLRFRLCKACARNHAGHRAPWRRGERWVDFKLRAVADSSAPLN